jgi:hypothetical protein
VTTKLNKATFALDKLPCDNEELTTLGKLSARNRDKDNHKQPFRFGELEETSEDHTVQVLPLKTSVTGPSGLCAHPF